MMVLEIPTMLPILCQSHNGSMLSKIEGIKVSEVHGFLPPQTGRGADLVIFYLTIRVTG